MSARKNHFSPPAVIPLLVFAGLTCLAYANSLHRNFVFDDQPTTNRIRRIFQDLDVGIAVGILRVRVMPQAQSI
jgi:hypothetical protein